MPHTITILTYGFGLFGLAFLVAAIMSLRNVRLMQFTGRLAVSISLLAMSSAFAVLTIATQGYRALTHEDTAAIVELQPLGPKRFRARLQLPNGHTTSYVIAGDQLYIDAHILKWKPIANFLGLHTAYSLDRIGGRYRTLEDEQHDPRTVYGIGRNRLLDMFNLRQRYEILAPLVDAEYGSATFVSINGPCTLHVQVSTSGLLIRKVAEPASTVTAE